jgi:hypothetical protein
LCWCFPTTGTKLKQTENNSPLVGPKPMLSLKLVSLTSPREFQTVVPYVDARDDCTISLGQVSKK